MSEWRVLRFGLRVGRRDFAAFYSSWPVWFAAWGVRSITAGAMIALLGRLVGSQDYVHYLLIGNSVIVGAHSAGWALQSSTWDRFDGTYPLLVVSPSGLRPSLIGRTSIWVLNGFLTSLTTFAVLAFAFGLPLPFPLALLVPLPLAVMCGSAYAFALSIGSFVVRVPRSRNVVHSFAMTVLAAFTGANVPVVFWPGWVQTLADGMPLTHGLIALRLLLVQGPAITILQELSLEVFVGLVWFAFAAVVMNIMANAGRAGGSIDFVGA